MLYSNKYASPIGMITLASDGNFIIGLWLERQRYYAVSMREEIPEKRDIPVFSKTQKWLDAYFAGKMPAIFDVPLAPAGSEFRKSVWDILCEIPYGGYTTYGAIAQKIAAMKNIKTMSSQAVGGAVGHNPISIIIPCHRVVGANGSLTGYGGGIEKKIKLLELEGVDMSAFFVPSKGTAL